MNPHSKFIVHSMVTACLLVATIASALGQDAGVGYIRFVNAIGLDGSMTMTMNGKAVNAKGYEAGEFTGGVGLEVGNYEFTFEHPLMKKLEKDIQVIDGVTMTYLIYMKPAFNEGGEVVGRELALCELEPPEAGGASVTVISLCEERGELPLQLRVGNTTKPLDLNLSPLRPKKVRFRRGGDWTLNFQNGVIASMTMSEPGDFAVVVYEMIDGNGRRGVRASLFLNERLNGRN